MGGFQTSGAPMQISIYSDPDYEAAHTAAPDFCGNPHAVLDRPFRNDVSDASEGQGQQDAPEVTCIRPSFQLSRVFISITALA